MKIRSVKEIKELKGRTVLLRTDYNIQVREGKLYDTERITRTYETIDYLLKHQARVVIISHLGRPDGERRAKYTLRPVARFLAKKYKSLVFVNDCQGALVERRAAALKNGQILMLENLRFYPHEENNDKNFAKKLARLADYYVNDAFAVSHRRHASVHEVTRYLPSFAGFNLLSEVENIDKALKNFKKPGLAIIGGAKISTKIKVIEKFLQRFDQVLVAGGLANNFLVNKGYNVGRSLVDKKYLKISKSFLKKYGNRIVLPVDSVISNSNKRAAKLRTVSLNQLNSLDKRFYIVDIGPKTRKLFKNKIQKAMTIVWNGPVSIIETKAFAKGTEELVRAFAARVSGKPFGLVGGGETVAMVNQLNVGKKIDFVSTGGGAMLEYIEKGELPGIKVLRGR